MLLTAFAGGGLLGSALAARARPRHPGLVAVCCQATFIACQLALAFSSSLVVLVSAFALAGAGGAVYSVFFISALQKQFPSAVLGRVMALASLGSLALMPLGLAITGPVVELVGASTVLIIGAVVVATTSFAVLRVPGVRDFRTSVPLSAAAGFR